MKSFKEMCFLMSRSPLDEGFKKGFGAMMAAGIPIWLAALQGADHKVSAPTPTKSVTHRTQTIKPILTITPSLSASTALKTPDDGEDVNQIGQYIGGHEGRKKRAYVIKGDKTIGIGHKLIPADQNLLPKINPDLSYSKVISKKQDLSDKDIDLLFSRDYILHRQRAQKFFPKFDSYPTYLKAALIDGVFRGDLSGSPATIKLINDDNWAKAASEYLDNREYRVAKASKSGVAKRMEENRNRFLQYADEIKDRHEPDFE